MTVDPTAYRMAKPYLDDGDLRLYHGDVLTVLRGLPSGIAQTCVTSPPYWGLRDYGTGTWTGGDEECEHVPSPSGGPSMLQGASQRGRSDVGACRCGAQRVDDQLGLEPTPTLYVERMVEVFREVHRVLRDDGTLWLNIGDSYTSGDFTRQGNPRNVPQLPNDWEGTELGGRGRAGHARSVKRDLGGLKPKDLVGIPWRLAFALQADGWYLRSDIIWAKPNPMPESVTDRPTKAHEYVFLFSKQPRYFYDADAVREPHAVELHAPGNRKWPTNGDRNDGDRLDQVWGNPAGRNLRSVWQIATQPFPEAHFATYPEELVRRCILAATSEHGECVECGTPWRRVVERGELEPTPSARISEWDRGKTDGHAGESRAANLQRDGFKPNHARPIERMSWEPSCSCTAETRPQFVLDPFIGSGTTGLVARKHGRRSIGIDLSAEYLEIAARRTQQLSLLGAAR